MAIKSYKCPSCGAGLDFKPALQKFRCDYCLSEYTEEEISDLYKDVEVEKVEQALESKVDLDHLASYNCNNCGAVVVTDDTTAATFCYFCHNPVIISDRLSGSFLPNKMIPFTIDKEVAQKTFLAWAKKSKFVPEEFYSDSQLEKITGIYLPYWWADCKVAVDYQGELDKVRIWQKGDIEYTETQKYQVIRKGSIELNNVEELAFTKIDKKLLDGIAPYDEKKARPFSMPYLSGFFAEQYDIDKEVVLPKIEDQIKRYSTSLVNDTISDHNSVRENKNSFDILTNEISYTLLPAWILTYQFGDKNYVFAINGQTGKSFGELPIDYKKVYVATGGVFLVTMLIFLLGGMFIW